LSSCAVLADPPSGQWPGQRRLYAQISLFCTVQLISTMNPKVAPNGGYARALLETVDDTLSRAEW
jgi:hypothetical protein